MIFGAALGSQHPCGQVVPWGDPLGRQTHRVGLLLPSPGTLEFVMGGGISGAAVPPIHARLPALLLGLQGAEGGSPSPTALMQ